MLPAHLAPRVLGAYSQCLLPTHAGVAPGQPLPPIILIVEDDADTRELYRTILDMEGFWVADAGDAIAAVEQAADVQPDVIITDIGLPGRSDGMDLARQLHTNPRTANVPVVALTGRPPSELAGGLFSEILQKPVLPEDFIAAVRRALTHSRLLRERADAARERVPQLLERSERLLSKSHRLMQTIRERRSDEDAG